MPERRQIPRRRSDLFIFAGPGETGGGAGLGWTVLTPWLARNEECKVQLTGPAGGEERRGGER